MLSDEEKQVVEWLNQSINEYNDIFQGKIEDESGIKRMKTIKNLIEKQSKEIEELKEKNRQGKMRIVQLENEITARIEDVNQYYTPNDKIKAKIEEYKKQQKEEPDAYLCIKVLRSLLEKE